MMSKKTRSYVEFLYILPFLILAALMFLIMTCATDEEFEAMWDEMIEQLNGFGYEELFEYDCGVWQPEVDAKIAAAAAAQ